MARPVARIQACETRACAFGPYVARHAVELFDRYIEGIAFRVLQKQIVAHDTRYLLAYDFFEQRNAVHRMNDVVARFERERDFGDIDMAAIAHARATPLRVVDRNHADFCRRNDHAQGDIHVDDVHDAFFQGTNIAMPPGVVAKRFRAFGLRGRERMRRLGVVAFVGSRVENFMHGQ